MAFFILNQTRLELNWLNAMTLKNSFQVKVAMENTIIAKQYSGLEFTNDYYFAQVQQFFITLHAFVASLKQWFVAADCRMVSTYLQSSSMLIPGNVLLVYLTQSFIHCAS